MANITIIEPHALLPLGLIQLLAELGPDIYLHSRDFPAPDTLTTPGITSCLNPRLHRPAATPTYGHSGHRQPAIRGASPAQ
jgi:hypothetical protein